MSPDIEPEIDETRSDGEASTPETIEEVQEITE